MMKTEYQSRSLRGLILPLFLGLTALGVLLGGCGGKQAQEPSIVFVVMDTVRDDLATLGDGGRPNLERLAPEATVYENAYATAPWTVPSHASMFTGLLPAGHGCTHAHPRLDSHLPTLAEMLAKKGYATAAFFSNPWLSDRTTRLLRGFGARFEVPVAGGVAGDPGRYRGDQGGRASVSNLRQWLKEQDEDRPFFAFVNLLEAHLPYDPPPTVRTQRLPDLPPKKQITGQWGMEYQAGLHPFDTVDWDAVQDLYWGDVASVDMLLGGILDTLEELGLDEDTIVIVCSDHGENLGEHHLNDHQFSVHETLLAVPLMIRAPGLLEPGRVGAPVMLSDLYATVVEMTGLTEAPVRPFSHSLLAEPPEATRPLLAEYARPQAHLVGSLQRLNPELDVERIDQGLRTVRVGNLRLTVADDGTAMLHDMLRDPGQEKNLAAERPEDVAALRQLLDGLLPTDGVGEPQEIPLDEATRKQLRSLGYVH